MCIVYRASKSWWLKKIKGAAPFVCVWYWNGLYGIVKRHTYCMYCTSYRYCGALSLSLYLDNIRFNKQFLSKLSAAVPIFIQEFQFFFSLLLSLDKHKYCKALKSYTLWFCLFSFLFSMPLSSLWIFKFYFYLFLLCVFLFSFFKVKCQCYLIWKKEEKKANKIKATCYKYKTYRT